MYFFTFFQLSSLFRNHAAEVVVLLLVLRRQHAAEPHPFGRRPAHVGPLPSPPPGRGADGAVPPLLPVLRFLLLPRRRRRGRTSSSSSSSAPLAAPVAGGGSGVTAGLAPHCPLRRHRRAPARDGDCEGRGAAAVAARGGGGGSRRRRRREGPRRGRCGGGRCRGARAHERIEGGPLLASGHGDAIAATAAFAALPAGRRGEDAGREALGGRALPLSPLAFLPSCLLLLRSRAAAEAPPQRLGGQQRRLDPRDGPGEAREEQGARGGIGARDARCVAAVALAQGQQQRPRRLAEAREGAQPTRIPFIFRGKEPLERARGGKSARPLAAREQRRRRRCR